jgi:hypothetical protein
MLNRLAGLQRAYSRENRCTRSSAINAALSMLAAPHAAAMEELR